MKIKSLYFITILIISCHIFASHSGGRATARNAGSTGAPGEAQVCGNCHNGGAFGTLTETLEIRNAGGSIVTDYVPGNTYSLVLTLSNSAGTPAAYGFQMTSLENTGDTNIGTWQNPSANTTIATTTASRTYVEHGGGASASNVFSMEWVAPAMGTGAISFYYVGNSVNGNGARSGDVGGSGSVIVFQEAVLPVEMTFFKAEKKDKSVLLSWETASELNNKGFRIERSHNGEDFKKIGWIDGTGNSSERQNYQFMDDSPSSGTNYYRLLQVDFDGQSNYSDTETVRFKSYSNFNIYPNPARGFVYMEFFAQKTQNANINIYHSNGQLVMTKTFALQQGTNTLDIPIQELTAGAYIISVVHDDRTENRKLNIVN